MKLNPQLRRLFLASLILLLSIAVYSQNKNPKTVELNKNVIYGNVSIGNDQFSKAVYYDRIFKNNMFWGSDNLHFVKIGIGKHKAIQYDDGNYVVGQYGLLIGTGGESHHLEIVAGLKYYYNGSLQGSLPISSSIGWRYQKPERLLVFRAGLGYPEIVYFGFGLSF